ncbi:MAG TPA: lactate permease LctP family transporter [Candidatus Polarisedimenticolia bacterium]|nr:lactate permease LctP family transporter [Candidatus Polarisedimenticolia bacterium]
MPTWTQIYDPFGHWWLSALVAALPIVVLFTMMAGFRVKPHWAALSGAATAVLVACLAFHMPVSLAAGSFLYGVSTGLLNIVWIVVAAVYLYDISVSTGDFEIMKSSVAGITADRRLQLLLVAFCFGAFIEGCAGFGSPVAIAGAFMIGLGFKPFHAAALNLIANTAPVAWGAIGTPVHMLATVTQMPEADMNAMIGRILPYTAIIVPFWLVRAMVPWKETFEVFPAILVVGISFASMQFFWSNYMDSNLVDITAGLFSLLCTVVFLLFWKPKKIWRFEEDGGPVAVVPAGRGIPSVSGGSGPEIHSYSAGRTFQAWLPFLILSVFVFLWGFKPVKTWMNVHTTPNFLTAEGKPQGGWATAIHNKISRDKPVVVKPTPEGARFPFIWLSATGTGCFLAALVGGTIRKVSPAKLLRIFGHTLFRMRWAVLAISAMLGLGFVTRYSGTDAVLGLAFTHTGWFFPFFGTFLGWLGVALTGSDTSSNALFGSLQKITAQQLGLDPVLMTAANSAGGVMGKMVDAQSICVATAATNQVGNEGMIFRFVVWHSIALGAIVGLIVMFYAYVAPQLVPHGVKLLSQ